MTDREKEIAAMLGAIFLMALAAAFVPVLFHVAFPAIVKLSFWIALSLYIWFRPRVRFAAKLRLVPFILALATLSGAIFVLSTYAAGVLTKISDSPYSKAPAGILLNILQFTVVSMLMEWVRNYIVNGAERPRAALAGAAVTFVYSLAWLNLLKLGGISDLQSFVSFVGGDLIPALLLNGFLCYMVYLGGAAPAVIFMAITTFPQWVMPILPDLNWLLTAIIGCAVPLLGLLVLRDAHVKNERSAGAGGKKDNPYGWLAVLAACVLVVWFAAGLFPIYPVTIMSGSMEPLLEPGDVVLVSKTEASKTQVGNIVEYWEGEFYVVHRVVDVYTVDGSRVYITKGDNNNVRDANPVAADQIRGKVIASIPKIGLLTYLLRSQ